MKLGNDNLTVGDRVFLSFAVAVCVFWGIFVALKLADVVAWWLK